MNKTYIHFTPEELEETAKRLGIEYLPSDFNRLAVYMDYFFSYHTEKGKQTTLDEELADYINMEEEQYEGEFLTGANFAEYIMEESGTMENFPDWVIIDYEATWDYALRHDYFIDSGHVWRTS